MGGSALARQQAGCRQDKSARADGDDPAAPCAGGGERLEQIGGNLFRQIAPPRNDDGSGPFQQLQATFHGDLHTAEGPQRTGLGRRDAQFIGRPFQLGIVAAEGFDGRAEFKGAQLVVDQHD